MRYHITPFGLMVIKNDTENKSWQGGGEKGTLEYCWWEWKLMQPLWKGVCPVLSIFNWVLVSLFLSCKNSLYVLITSSLSHTCFANILFHRAEVNVLINSNLLIFFLYWMDFLIMLRCQDSPNWLTVLQNSYQNPSWLFIEIDKLILNSSSTPEDLE